jgi:hypothetical protein
MLIPRCSRSSMQSTPGYTSPLTTYVERWFWTIGEMLRRQLEQFDMDEELWEDARRHGKWLYNHVPPARMILGEPWLSPRQRQYPELKVTDLLTLKPFGTVCWMHIKKERRAGKRDGYPRESKGN